jgi:hypothetical protein
MPKSYGSRTLAVTESMFTIHTINKSQNEPPLPRGMLSKSPQKGVEAKVLREYKLANLEEAERGVASLA